MIEKLNNYIASYVDNYSLKYHPEFINHIRKIADLILENEPDLEEREYDYDVDINDSQRLAFEFLEYLNINLSDIIKPDIESLNITFKDFDKLKEGDIKTSYSDCKNKEIKVQIVCYHDLSDVYTIIHELMHATNIIVENDYAKKVRRDLLTETISLLATVEAEKYFLSTRNNKEYENNKLNDYYGIISNAHSTYDTLKLVDVYLAKGKIDISDLKDINSNTINEIMTYQEVQIPFYERYLLAYVLVNYIEKNYDGKNVLIELNKMIKKNNLSEILNYLDLDFDVILTNDGLDIITDISDNTLNKFKDSLKNKVK